MGVFATAMRLAMLAVICMMAYNIRLYALKEFGNVIHEFDPWFNFRATKYLADNGWTKFFSWFDHESWYPLGRPVGSTIYPGMQITSVVIWRALEMVGYPMSLNDVCCYVPAWFGVTATLFLGLLTKECTNDSNAAVVAAAIMSIIPAHIMRSVGGGFDNESIAMTAICGTFYFYCRSLRDDSSWLWGIATGLMYIFMVAAWGGYIFVVNMIGFHAALTAIQVIVKNEDVTKLHRAYSLFFVIGTFGAVHVPVVGWSPLKSLEQLFPFFVFLGLQAMALVEHKRKAEQLDDAKFTELRVKVFGGAVAAVVAVILLLAPTGYFGPLSSRVRGLFVRHTRTGNPLVDSVAEHQPASADAYYQNLHMVYYLAPAGLFLTSYRKVRDSTTFLVYWGLVAYFFSSKMARLIILLGPIASALGGVALAALLQWCVDQLRMAREWFGLMEPEKEEEKPKDASKGSAAKKLAGKKKKVRRKDMSPTEQWAETYNDPSSRTPRTAVAVFVLLLMPVMVPQFYGYCHMLARHMSHPSIMFKGRNSNGQEVLVDDYREAYWWLRDHTPKDSRVMAWWDYGYQIAGIAERTTIADGNTWNHEHIATLARCLVSKEKNAHKMIKHLADYVLVWTGGGGDDLAKSIHIARIGNSVYKGICSDPVCSKFGMTQTGPTKMMAHSLIYKLHSGGSDGVEVDPELFQEVYSSKHRKVRIYKVMGVSEKSKAWAAEPANKLCDAPGSWYCPGQYPPALDFVLKQKKAFKQLEDFNVEDDEEAKAYEKEYMAAMDGRGRRQD